MIYSVQIKIFFLNLKPHKAKSIYLFTLKKRILVPQNKSIMKNISDKNQTRIHFHNVVKHLSSDDRSRSVYCVVFYNSFYSLIAETDTINITRFVAAKSFEFTFVHKQTNITEN